MKIGFYGDSYCDLQFFHNSYYLENPLAYPRELKTWPARIIDDFDSKTKLKDPTPDEILVAKQNANPYQLNRNVRKITKKTFTANDLV